MDKISEKMTAAACSQSECEECEIQGKLLCVPNPKVDGSNPSPATTTKTRAYEKL